MLDLIGRGKMKMKNIEITKMFEIGVLNSHSDPQVCIKILDGVEGLLITPEFISDVCVYLYGTVLDQCEECFQNEFERKFRERFDKIWESKENTDITIVPGEDVTEK